MPDEKVKAQVQKIEVPLGLGIDSPMVIFHTDLETLGLTGGGTSSGGRVPSGGGTSPGSVNDTPPPTSRAAKLAYIAMCDRVQHAGGAGDGVVDGVWFGTYSTNFDDALASAAAHEDGLAFVAVYLNNVLVGPVTHP